MRDAKTVRPLIFTIIFVTTLGRFSWTTETSVSDLLSFAEPKYNRAAVYEQGYPVGQGTLIYVFQENVRLKNALETMDKAQEETKKQEQWKIIVEEFQKSALLPDAVSVLEGLPEEEQIRFLTACLQNGRIMDEQVPGSFWLHPNWHDRGLYNNGIIKRMRYDLLKKLLLRKDFENAQKLVEEQPRPTNTVIHIFSEFCAALPISVFKNHPEIKDLNDYYRLLENSECGVLQFRTDFCLDQEKKRQHSVSWQIPEDQWACIAIQQALFQDFDLAVESAQKIGDDDRRHFILFAIAANSAAYGNVEKALELWENFPPAMFERDFAQKFAKGFPSLYWITGFVPSLESDPAYSGKGYLLALLLKNQMQGGFQAGPIPIETILPAIQGNTLVALVVFKYLYANRHIDELCELIEQYEFFSDQYHVNFGSNPVATLCHFSTRSLLLGEREESQQLHAKAFDFMRKFDGKSNPDLKKKLMYVIADKRFKFGQYDYNESFTREELAFTNPRGGSGSLHWFLIKEEQKVMREREIDLAMAGIRYSEAPFFAAAAKAALKNDHAEALISTGKGLAKNGEKELAVEYYCHAISVAEKIPGSGMESLSHSIWDGIIGVYGHIAQSLIATQPESPMLDEMFELIQKARNNDNYTEYYSTIYAIARKCGEMQNDELFEKFLKHIPTDSQNDLRHSRNEAKRWTARQQNAAPPVRRVEELPLPKPATEFDFYANEFRELEGWRNPLLLLQRKMPSPDEARQAVQRVRDGKEAKTSFSINP